MKVLNKGKNLLCFQTKDGRVDVLPGMVTTDDRLDALKGKDKIFDHYLDEEILKEVKADGKKAGGNGPTEVKAGGKKAGGNGPTEKDLLQAELTALGGTPGNLGVKKLQAAVKEALEDKAIDLDIDYEGLSLDELRLAVKEDGEG